MKGNNGISKIIKDGGAGWNLCGVRTKSLDSEAFKVETI